MKSDPGSIYSREGLPSGGPLVSDCVRLKLHRREMEGGMGTRVDPSSRGRKLNESGFALVSSGYVQGNGHVRGMEGDWGWNWTSISNRT